MTHKECPKRVLHLSLDISTAGMAFQPGDAVGVCPSNEPHIVDELLSTIALDGSECAPWHSCRCSTHLPFLSQSLDSCFLLMHPCWHSAMLISGALLAVSMLPANCDVWPVLLSAAPGQEVCNTDDWQHGSLCVVFNLNSRHAAEKCPHYSCTPARQADDLSFLREQQFRGM